jgi:high-affinity K+ transport system ATPase subunit B|tara:strand:+ start:59 stop:265 length:207 start_codon:yes stop_codon:yes gene_type:complete
VSEGLPDKAGYQKNRRYMCWALLVAMLATTIATLLHPERMAEAESIIMTQYLAMSGVVGAYFGFTSRK